MVVAVEMSLEVGSVHGSNLENDKDIQWDPSDDEGVADSQIKPRLTSKHRRSPTLIEEELQQVVQQEFKPPAPKYI